MEFPRCSVCTFRVCFFGEFPAEAVWTKHFVVSRMPERIYPSHTHACGSRSSQELCCPLRTQKNHLISQYVSQNTARRTGHLHIVLFLASTDNTHFTTADWNQEHSLCHFAERETGWSLALTSSRPVDWTCDADRCSRTAQPVSRGCFGPCTWMTASVSSTPNSSTSTVGKSTFV